MAWQTLINQAAPHCCEYHGHMILWEMNGDSWRSFLWQSAWNSTPRTWTSVPTAMAERLCQNLAVQTVHLKTDKLPWINLHWELKSVSKRLIFPLDAWREWADSCWYLHLWKNETLWITYDILFCQIMWSLPECWFAVNHRNYIFTN